MSVRTLALLFVAASFSTGCVHHDHQPSHRGSDHHVGHGHGPPPHAPAHGYRAKMHGRDLEYDAGRRVYVVLGLRGVYWQSGWYFKLVRDRWLRSSSWDGPWHDSLWGDIPPGLRGGKHKGKAHGHGRN